MKQVFYNLQINTNGQKLYEFTDKIIDWINKNNFKNGMINLSIQHTSASLMIQENAVLGDMLEKLNCSVENICAPFSPMTGAYGQGRTFSHSH